MAQIDEKPNVKPSDGQAEWIRKLTYKNPELTHLYQPPKKWKAPKGIKLLKYSRRSAEALAYERLRLERRGLPFSE